MSHLDSVRTPSIPSASSGRLLGDYIPLREATDLFPKNRRGKHPSLSQVYRWSKSGKHGVVLAAWLVGTCRCTTAAAIKEFIAQLSAVDGLQSRPPAVSDGLEAAKEAGEWLRQTVFGKDKSARHIR